MPSPQLFRPVVESMIEEKTEDWDLLYLYLHPEQRPNDLQVLANDADFASMVGRPWTQDGFHSWCLLAYVVSQRGARRLVDLAATEELVERRAALGQPEPTSLVEVAPVSSAKQAGCAPGTCLPTASAQTFTKTFRSKMWYKWIK